MIESLSQSEISLTQGKRNLVRIICPNSWFSLSASGENSLAERVQARGPFVWIRSVVEGETARVPRARAHPKGGECARGVSIRTIIISAGVTPPDGPTTTGPGAIRDRLLQLLFLPSGRDATDPLSFPLPSVLPGFLPFFVCLRCDVPSPHVIQPDFFPSILGPVRDNSPNI